MAQANDLTVAEFLQVANEITDVIDQGGLYFDVDTKANKAGDITLYFDESSIMWEQKHAVDGMGELEDELAEVEYVNQSSVWYDENDEKYYMTVDLDISFEYKKVIA
jgi:hypothetical protein